MFRYLMCFVLLSFMLHTAGSFLSHFVSSVREEDHPSAGMYFSMFVTVVAACILVAADCVQFLNQQGVE